MHPPCPPFSLARGVARSKSTRKRYPSPRELPASRCSAGDDGHDDDDDDEGDGDRGDEVHAHPTRYSTASFPASSPPVVAIIPPPPPPPPPPAPENDETTTASLSALLNPAPPPPPTSHTFCPESQ